MESALSILKLYPLAENLLQSCPLNILQKMRIVDYPKAKFRLYQGEVYSRVYIILDGIIRVYVMDEKGKEITLALYKQGNLVGEHEAMNGQPFSASIEALSNVKLIEIATKDYLCWLQQDSNFSYRLIDSLCNQLYELTRQTIKYGLADVKTQVLLTLYQEYSKLNRRLISKKHILTNISATKRSIYRMLNILVNEGLIRINEDTVEIINVEQLVNKIKKIG